MDDWVSAEFAALVTLQAGVISCRQALAAGLSRDQVDYRVASGRWRQVYRGVYATFTGALPLRARLWAAVLYAGSGAVLSHETAGWLHGLPLGSELIHVSIPKDRRVIAAAGIKVHRAIPGLVLPGMEYPPQTTIEETLLDLAASSDGDTICGLVTRAFQLGRIREYRLREAMGRRQKLRWRRELGELIDVAVAGDESVLEVRHTRDVERKHGLPEARRQAEFTGPDGKRGRRDRLYEPFGVIVELDGRIAHEGKERQDRSRDNAALAEGKQTLRYGWTDVRFDPCRVAGEIARVLRRRGWAGHPVPCSPGCQVSGHA